jgi:membrane-bound lytic murein transglycosylase D
MINSRKFRALLFSGIAVLIFILLMLIREDLGFSKSNDEKNNRKDPKNTYAIFPTDIPDNLEFAGEPVPLKQIDIRESLDREILVNTYFQSQTLLYIKRANRYFPVIESILKKNGIPSDFKYLVIAESGLMNAVSPANAVGFWQLLEGTARDYGLEVNNEIDERYHLEKSTSMACKFILESYNKYGTWTLAAASYNTGRKNIDTQIERQKQTNYYKLLLGDETDRYIYRILSYKLILSDPSKYGFHLGTDDLYPEIPCFEVSIEGSVPDFAEFAQRYGISYKILKLHNPWLREAFLTNKQGKTYYVKIPRDGIYRSNSVNQVEYDSLALRKGI